MLIFGSLRR